VWSAGYPGLRIGSPLLVGSKPAVPKATAVLPLQATSLREENGYDEPERPISPHGREAISRLQRNDGYRAGMTQNHRAAKCDTTHNDAKIDVSVAKSFLR
jgi:hypothetical protein